jgi:protein-tyrosine phosphatase
MEDFGGNLNGFFFYRLQDGRLIGSENPCCYPHVTVLVADIVRLFGVRVMVTLTAEFTDFGLPGLRQYHRPLPSPGVPAIAQVREVVELVLQHLRRGEPAWCHCQRGTDRTGCVLGCCLVAQGVPPEVAIRQVTDAFPPGRRTPRLLALWEPYAQIIWEFAAD